MFREPFSHKNKTFRVFAKDLTHKTRESEEEEFIAKWKEKHKINCNFAYSGLKWQATLLTDRTIHGRNFKRWQI